MFSAPRPAQNRLDIDIATLVLANIFAFSAPRKKLQAAHYISHAE